MAPETSSINGPRQRFSGDGNRKEHPRAYHPVASPLKTARKPLMPTEQVGKASGLGMGT